MGKCNYIAVFFLTIAILVNNNNYLAVIQLTGWGKMVVDYTADRSFGEALKKTFSGEEPCDLCRVVSRAQANKDSRSTSKEKKESGKVEFVKKQISTELFIIENSAGGHLMTDAPVSFKSYIGLLPVPPPRAKSRWV